MAYQTFLDNRTHKPSMTNWIFPSLSTTTTGNLKSSSIPPSPDDMAPSITSSDSGADSTFSFPTPLGFGTDPQESTFGDLGGFKSYQGCDIQTRDNIQDDMNETPLNHSRGHDIYSTSDKPFSSSATGAPSHPPVQQGVDYAYSYGLNTGSEKFNPGTTHIPRTFTSSSPSTSRSPTATLAPASAPETFQFSFRMAPPSTGNVHTRGQAQKGASSGGRKKTLSPTRNFPPATTSTFSSDITSKPLTLQFNTRNGQSVLSLSTPAREAAALKEKMRSERGSGGVDPNDGKSESASMGSKGKDKNEREYREENSTWRNIKPAPTSRPTNPYASSTSSIIVSASGETSNPQHTLAQSQSQPASIQGYHDTYVPYDMYEQMIHGSIGSHTIAQHQHRADMGRAQTGYSHSQMQSPVQDFHNSQSPQHLTTQFQLRNPYPPLSSPVTAYTTAPTHGLAPNPSTNVGNSTVASGPQLTNPYPIIQSSLETHMNAEENRPANVANGALKQQGRGQSLSLAPSTSSNQYPTPRSAQVDNISTSYSDFQREASTSVSSQPSSFFRRPNGACTRCKRMKMKCTFPPIPSGAFGGLQTIPEADIALSLGPSPHPLPSSLACIRCATANHPCIVEGRKPRTPSQSEALLASLRQTDATIATLLAPFQPSEQDAKIVLNGAKIIEAMGKGDDTGNDGSTPTPDVTPASDITIGPVERAALLANDKGGSVKERRPGLGFGKTKQKKLAVSIQNTSTNSDEDSLSSDNSDSNDSDADDVWDNEAERAVLNGSTRLRNMSSSTRASVETSATGSSKKHSRDGSVSCAAATLTVSRHSTHALQIENQLKMHLHTLPPLNTPLGIIARLSLEGMGEKLKQPKNGARAKTRYHPQVKIESRSESIPPLVGQKRRRAAGDVGDERDDVMEDEDESDVDEESSVATTDRDGVLDSEKDNGETTEMNGVVSPSESRSITLGDAQSLSLSSLVITELDGPAHRAYFAPGLVSNLPLRRIINSRAPAPPILSSGLVTWEECERLFDIYYEYVHPYCTVLDDVLHTVQTVYERDPFLFTVVLAVSSRYYTSRPGLYKIAMHYAKAAAASAFVNGIKSVEMVQAYLIMCNYSLPARRWEEDRSWFYGGLAFRIATDLNLDKSFDDFKLNMKMDSLTGSTGSTTNSVSERQEREKLNRMRTWLNCFNVDRSSSTQWGKPATLAEGEPIRKAKEWWRCSLYNHPYDLHLVAYTELLRIVSRFHEQVYSDPMSKTGLNKNANFQKITEQIEIDIKDWHDNTRWHYDSSTTKSTRSSSQSPSASSPTPTLRSSNRARASSSPTISLRRSPPMGDLESDPALIVRIEGVPVFENYMRLVMYSFGFEQAWRKWKARRSKSTKADAGTNMMLSMDMDLDLDGGDMFFVKCLRAASAVVSHLSDVYGPSGYLKFAPDCFFVMGGFCGAFLLKMLRPAFAPLLDSTQRERIIQVVTRFVNTLDSPASSIDATHTPRLYAKFLRKAMKDVIGFNASSLEPKPDSDTTQVNTTEVVTQSQQTQALAPSSTITACSTTLAPSTLTSHLHSQTPGTANGYGGAIGVDEHTSTGRIKHDAMGVGPALLFSGSSKGGNSGSSTPLATRTPTPSIARSCSSSNNHASHSVDMQLRWNRQELDVRESGFVECLKQAPLQAQALPPHLEYQAWSHNGIHNNAGNLDVGLGAAVMTYNGADTHSWTNGGHMYTNYVQPQSTGGGPVDSYSQPQLHNGLHGHGSFSWFNQQYVPFTVLQPGVSGRLPGSSAMATNGTELEEDDMLATMRAVSSDNWNSSVIMPGYGWGPDEDVGMTDV